MATRRQHQCLIDILLIVTAAACAAYPIPGHNDRVGIGAGGGAPNAGCSYASISPDGRFVAFQTGANDIVAGDTNLAVDVYLRDRVIGTSERISLASDGTQPNAPAWDPSVNGDGRYVAFRSEASNLVPLDTNSATDIFVRDRATGHTDRVSVASNGAQANGASVAAAISRDGRYVAFQSAATNLVSGDTNGVNDVFVYDRQTHTTERMSLGAGGAEANGNSFRPSFSGDGRLVFFYSDAANLVSGDTNGVTDLFVRDRQTGATERLSVATDGTEANDLTYPTARPAISGDGRFVAFFSAATNLVPSDTNANTDCFVRDRLTGVTERASVRFDGADPGIGGAASLTVGISDDGRYVAFEASARLSPEDTNNFTDIYVVDRQTGEAELVSTNDQGWTANLDSFAAVIDASGRYPAFSSFASNLDNLPPGAGGFYTSLFARDRGPAVGVLNITASKVDDQVSVLGVARYTGVQLATADDPPNDGATGAGVLAGELTGASVTYRPELADLFVQIRLAGIPQSVLPISTPSALYEFDFEIKGAHFQVRAQNMTNGQQFALFNCQSDSSCTQVATLNGGIGTAGSDVRVAIPLSAISAAEGDGLTNMHVASAIGTVPSGSYSVLDEVSMPSATLPRRIVTAGVAAPGTPESSVDFSVAGQMSDAAYYASFGALPAGQWDLWARACLGNQCGSAVIAGYSSTVPPVQLTGFVSRKVHGSAGTYDVDLTNGAIECRSGGANGDYTLVFTFANPLASVGAATASAGSVTNTSATGNQYIVQFTGLTSGQRIDVTLNDVRDTAGHVSSIVSAKLPLLAGDTTNDANVNSADIAQTKSQSGTNVTNSNFREDLNADGTINSADIALAKSKTGTALP